MVDYLIVGAGIYGATCARLLTDKGYSCLVIDKRTNIGGNCYTENRDGINIHVYGPHIFHTDDDEVWEFVNKFSSFNKFQLNTLANYKDKLYHLPFNLTTMYELFNTYNISKIKDIIESEKLKFVPQNDNDCLENEAVYSVGTTIYNTLIKGYTEKQWGKKCHELPKEIIKRLPIRTYFNNNYFNDKYQGIPNEEDGYNTLIENMLKGINTLTSIDFLKNRDYWINQVKHNVIYCGAPDELMDYCFGELEWRSLKFDLKCFYGEFQGNAVINYTDKDIPYTRIIEHKWFCPEKCIDTETSRNWVTYEYPQKWDRDKERYYPINNSKNNALYKKYVESIFSRYPSIVLAGRLGKYAYFDMDDAIKDAMELVEYITFKESI